MEVSSIDITGSKSDIAQALPRIVGTPKGVSTSAADFEGLVRNGHFACAGRVADHESLYNYPADRLTHQSDHPAGALVWAQREDKFPEWISATRGYVGGPHTLTTGTETLRLIGPGSYQIDVQYIDDRGRGSYKQNQTSAYIDNGDGTITMALEDISAHSRVIVYELNPAIAATRSDTVYSFHIQRVGSNYRLTAPATLPKPNYRYV